MTVKKLLIDHDNSGRRLDNYLISIYKSVPKSKIYSIIRKGEVRINSSRVKPSYKLRKDDLVRIPPNLESPLAKLKNISIGLIETHTNDILFEDNNYLVTNKKNNIAVHSGSKNHIGLIDIFRNKYGDGIDLCHRLDKTTSGCLVFGKNKKAVKHFNDSLLSQRVTKIYTAIIKGNFSGKKIISNQIYKSIESKSKDSISVFKLNRKLKSTTVVDVKIYTGRTHQIRIHASQMNHPIIFDKKYGDEDFDKSLSLGNRNIALHSKNIIFDDTDSKLINITCENPSEFNELVDKLS